MSTPISSPLTRVAFRDGVFARDHHQCVFCDQLAVDAHHIIERRLWSDGGYYLANGASICQQHHLACEMTAISVEAVREAAGIRHVIVPSHLYADQAYDKWGNPVLANGQRLKGELFFDEGVQKMLSAGGMLDLFVDKVKYPRTPHLPWSEGINDDDRIIDSTNSFVNKRVVVTVKMDGENTSLYSTGMHARSVDSRNHPSRSRVKQLWAGIAGDIPAGWRLCGENLFAQHSISYENLPSYFMGFSLWNTENICLSWDETLEWFSLLEVTPVQVLYDGIYDERTIRALYDSKKHWSSREGYVVRLAEPFSYGQFRQSVAKFVRRGHVQTSKHWMHGQRIIPNKLVGNLHLGRRNAFPFFLCAFFC
jgi:hypothetical protein